MCDTANTAYQSLEQLIPIHLKDNPAPYYIANILREAIYRGILHEGESLHQSQLAERLKVSPIPLREALRLLEMEGLVDFRGRRGAVVTGLNTDEIQEIYEMIIALESHVLRVALPKIPASSFKKAHEILAKMAVETDCIVWQEQNMSFHGLLYDPADRPMTLDHIALLRRQVDRYIRIYLETIRKGSQEEHEALLAAVETRDATKALPLLAKHLESTSRRLQTCLKAAKS